MIIEAVYEGPKPEVTIPGFAKKFARKGEAVKCRLVDGCFIGGDWKITKGEKEYLAAIEERKKARAKHMAERAAEKRKRIEEAEMRQIDPIETLIAQGEQDATKSAGSKLKPVEGDKS